jgi:hypothetical protein
MQRHTRGLGLGCVLAWLWCAVPPAAIIACADNRAAPPALSPSEVLAEMSRRSAVPEAELEQRLTNCDADQQSMYFCAFRDFIAVDLQLDRLAAAWALRHPECKEPIEHQLHDLKQARDSACAKSAEEEYGAGSIAQTAIAVCASSSTKPLLDQVAALDRCPLSRNQAE